MARRAVRAAWRCSRTRSRAPRPRGSGGPQRKVEEWRPAALLCKRFNVPDPYHGRPAELQACGVALCLPRAAETVPGPQGSGLCSDPAPATPGLASQPLHTPTDVPLQNGPPRSARHGGRRGRQPGVCAGGGSGLPAAAHRGVCHRRGRGQAAAGGGAGGAPGLACPSWAVAGGGGGGSTAGRGGRS